MAVAGVGSRGRRDARRREPTTDWVVAQRSFEALREYALPATTTLRAAPALLPRVLLRRPRVGVGHLVSSTLIRCPTAPMNSFGPQPLSITLNGQQYHPTGVSFNLYKRLPRWGLGALPLSMPLDVGAKLTLTADADLSYGTDYRLVVEDGEGSVVAQESTTYENGVVAFTLPPVPPLRGKVGPRQLSLRVSPNGQQFSPIDDATLTAYPAPTPFAVAPRGAYAGRAADVTILGDGYVRSPGARPIVCPSEACVVGCPCCRCDGLAVPATIVSATQIRCTLPETAGAGGRAPIEVSLNGQNYHGGADVECSQLATVLIVPVGCYGNGDCKSNKCECRVGYSGDTCDVGPVPLTALPAAGPQQGGTRMLLRAHASAPTARRRCSTSCSSRMARAAQCSLRRSTTPLTTWCPSTADAARGTVALRVSINGGLDFSESSVPFTFTFEPSITGLEPASGPVGGASSSRSPAPSSVPPLS